MTAVRQFTSTDSVTVYVEVYDNIRTAPSHVVTVRTELRSASGATVRSISHERPSAALISRDGGYGFLSELPLTDIPPGSYVIRVEARADTPDTPGVSRDIPVRIAAP